MEQFMNYLKDAFARLKAKSPKFFVVLQYICISLVAFLSLAIWLNSSYAFEWEKIMIYKQMNLVKRK